MACNLCNIARLHPEHRMFCPSCLWCGARLIQRLSSLAIGVTACRVRRSAVLADWMAFGHSEAQLRLLAKGVLPLAPVPSELPTPVKPRSHRLRRR
jgi:hypothetical protein